MYRNITFDEIYRLGNKHIRGTLHVTAHEGLTALDNDTATRNGFRILRGELRIKEPLIYVYKMGGKPRDLIGTTHAALYLVSDKVVNILKSNGFTGWSTYPVEVYGKDGKRIEGYHGFFVTVRCGPIDNSQSKEEWGMIGISGRKIKQKRWVGLYFDLKTWDGSDFFVPEGTGLVLVTEDVKNALKKGKVSNVVFKRLSEFERILL